MKLLIVRGNPRKDGYTQRITDIVADGARAAGAQVTGIDLMQKRIEPCIGCYACWNATPGVCRFHDDMPRILDQILETDILLCSTPLYYYSVSSMMKIFLERTFPLAKEGCEQTPSGLMRNTVRYPERWKNKRLGYISAGALKESGNFSAMHETFRLLGEGFSMELCARIVRPESYLMQFELAKPKTVRTIETALARAGAELATEGQVSDETHEKIAIPLAIDMPHFRKYTAIYWEHAQALGKEALSLSKVQRAVIGDVRILMSEMARSLDTVAASRLVAVLQFDFPDKDMHFRISVNRGTCVLEEAHSETCDLRVTVDTSVWSQVFTREINVRDALMHRKILLEGDKMLFTRLDRYFPPPVS